MTRAEFIAVLACFAVALALGVWLIWSRIWGRRRIPPRLNIDAVEFNPAEHVTMTGLTAKGRARLEQLKAEYPDEARRVDDIFAEAFTNDPNVVVMRPGEPWCLALARYRRQQERLSERARRQQARRSGVRPPLSPGKPPRPGSGRLRASFADFLAGGPDYMDRTDG